MKPARTILLVLLAATPGTFAQDLARQQLNEHRVLVGDVTRDSQISPDGSTVVYVADQDADETLELYSVPIGGGAATKLNRPLVAGGSVLSFRISPDGSTVVYRADQDTDEVFELYSVPIGGGSATKLNGPLVAGGSVAYFRISPDDSTVIYVADQDADETLELYSVPIGGGAATKLNGPLVAGGSVLSFRISPDGSTVVYRADQDTDETLELYSVPIGGGAATKLNGPLVAGGSVLSFRISPDGSTVVYYADQDTDGTLELYSVPIGGGAVTKLNGAIVAGGSVAYFRFSPDGSTVVYRADQDTDETLELYSVPIGGGDSTKLNGPLVAGGSVLSFQISPDSSTVVYLADQDTDGVSELYSVPIGGENGKTIKLNGPLVAGGGVSWTSLIGSLISPDSSTVVYRADQDTDNVYELYSVPIGGGDSTKLNGPVVAGGSMPWEDFSRISPDSSTVVYRAAQDTAFVYELYSVPIGGGDATKLNGAIVAGGRVGDLGGRSYLQISPDGSTVVYRADQDTDNVYELYSVPIGGGDATKLNGAIVLGGYVYDDFQVSPDESTVVYRAEQDADNVSELYSVPIGGGAATKLNGALVGNVEGFQISPDGSTVVYRADQDTNNVYELYRVPIGGGAVTKLNGALVEGGDVSSPFKISPDSSTVVYHADQDTDYVSEIYRVPIGGGAVTKLNGALVAGRDVWADFKISPDSSTVVYRSDHDTNETVELYRVPIAGGAVTKLNGALVAGGDVEYFRISPDGSTVVYRADQDTDGVSELYRVPLGGGAVTKLNGPLVAGGDVKRFQISPDGSTVVYRADQDTNEVYELYRVPIGGGDSTKLNGPLVAGGDVYADFQISPDDSTVVYLADQDTDGVSELYRVPIGGGDSTKLNGPLVAGGDVYADFQISPDDSTVVYRADQDTDQVNELYRVPIGSGAVIKLNGALVAGGDVYADFQISPDSSTVVYLADQDTDNVTDLYAIWLQNRWVRAGGTWSEGSNWSSGEAPDSTVEAVIATPAVVRIPWGDFATARSLVLGGGAGSSTILLSGGAVLELPLGARVEPGGVLGGDGLIWMGEHPLDLPAGSGLRARYGDSLVIQSGPLTNAGRIEALGTPALPVELELAGELVNAAGTGAVVAHHSLLRFPGGVRNGGSLAFGGGFNDVLGEITNLPGGLITVSGGATVIFHEDVANGGVITVSASGALASTAIFFGEFSGNGIAGSGTVFIEGDMRPGFSPGTMSFGGDLGYGPLATLHLEIGGPGPGQYDRVEVDGNLDLGGTLVVEFIDGYLPEAGTTFQLLQSGTRTGSFTSVVLPPLPDGRQWDLTRLESDGILAVRGTLAEAWLAENFAATDLANPALQATLWGWDADPDGDGIANRLEYALGGDPQVASSLFADGRPLGADLEVIDGVAVLRHPERTDKEMRGLDYVVEFSRDLENWSVDPPPGASSSLGEHTPPVAGFRQRVIRWPTTARDFIRLRVTLAE